MKENTYELFREDDITWISIEPLMNDINDALIQMRKISEVGLDSVDVQQLRLKIVGLEAIYTFLGGLVTEQNLKELREKHGVSENDTHIIH
jgi:hypothetical protein